MDLIGALRDLGASQVVSEGFIHSNGSQVHFKRVSVRIQSVSIDFQEVSECLRIASLHPRELQRDSRGLRGVSGCLMYALHGLRGFSEALRVSHWSPKSSRKRSKGFLGGLTAVSRGPKGLHGGSRGFLGVSGVSSTLQGYSGEGGGEEELGWRVQGVSRETFQGLGRSMVSGDLRELYRDYEDSEERFKRTQDSPNCFQSRSRAYSNALEDFRML